MLDPKSEILAALYQRDTDGANRLADAADSLTIWEAAALGRDAVADRALSADPAAQNLAGADGNVPLGLAAFFGHGSTVRLLLERGADVHAVAQNFMRVQPLHAAVGGRCAEAVEAILAHGPDVNARQQFGYTPLMGAAAAGREDLADLLMQHGADPSVVSEDGKTAADVAREHNFEALATRLERQP